MRIAGWPDEQLEILREDFREALVGMLQKAESLGLRVSCALPVPEKETVVPVVLLDRENGRRIAYPSPEWDRWLSIASDVKEVEIDGENPGLLSWVALAPSTVRGSKASRRTNELPKTDAE